MHLRQDYQTILRVVRQVATLRIVLVLRMENVNEWNCSMVKIFVADVLNVKVIVHVHHLVQCNISIDISFSIVYMYILVSMNI